MNCTPALTVVGPFMLLLGAGALFLGAMAWLRPRSHVVESLVFEQYKPESTADPLSRLFGLTRERAGPANLWVWRFLGPINGSVFFWFGFWVTLAQIRCGEHLPSAVALLGPVEITPWFPSICFTLFAAAIGFWNSYRMGTAWCLIMTALAAGFGFAGSQSAGFHVGIQAKRWFVICAALALIQSTLYFIRSRVIAACRRPT